MPLPLQHPLTSSLSIPPSNWHLNRDIGECNTPSARVLLRWNVNHFIIIIPSPHEETFPARHRLLRRPVWQAAHRQCWESASVNRRQSLTPPRVNTTRRFAGCGMPWLLCSVSLSETNLTPGQVQDYFFYSSLLAKNHPILLYCTTNGMPQSLGKPTVWVLFVWVLFLELLKQTSVFSGSTSCFYQRNLLAPSVYGKSMHPDRDTSTLI